MNNTQSQEWQEKTKYVDYLEKRIEECLEENKRYHAKYVDIREFSYVQVESLMR